MNEQPRRNRPTFLPAERRQDNVLAALERRLLDAICARLPDWISPDGLTLTGLAGALGALVGYASSLHAVAWLGLSIGGIVLHWVGDSLDGSLARHRRRERPAYGYFLDHSVDALSIALMVGGLGLTPFVRVDAALAALLAYQFLCIYVYLDTQVTGVFRLSFLAVGPTELRLSLIMLIVAMMVIGDVGLRLGTIYLTLYDGALLLVACGSTALFVALVAGRALALRRRDM